MGNNPFQIKPSMPYIGQIYTPPEKVQIGGAGVQGGGKVGGTQGGIGRNPVINNDDMQNFYAILGNCNLNKPNALNSDPAAGPIRTFDLTA